MIIIRRSIDLSVRDELAKHFTVTNKLEWNLIAYLLYESQMSDGKPIRLSDERLALMSGKDPKNFKGKKCLEKFYSYSGVALKIESENVDWKTKQVPLNDGWRAIKSQPKTKRYISSITWPKEVLEAFSKAQSGYKTSRVEIETGKPYTRRKKELRMAKTKQQIISNIPKTKSDIGDILIKYLNETPTNQFTRTVNKNIDSARTVAKQSKNSRAQLSTLEFIEHELPQPVYRPAQNSTRIFTAGQSICILERDVRKTLTNGWREADLKNAQLAIIAKIWNIPKLSKFLESSESFWLYMFKNLQWEENSEDKNFIKRAVYALVFGAMADEEKKTFNGILVQYNKPKEVGQKLLKVPLIRSIVRKRAEQFRRIKKDGGCFDSFGNWLTFSKEKGHSKRSILAQVAQSYELAILEPVIMWFVKNKHKKDMPQLLLWQHDGFSFSCKPSKIGQVQNLLSKKVLDKCSEFGITTRLEFS